MIIPGKGCLLHWLVSFEMCLLRRNALEPGEQDLLSLLLWIFTEVFLQIDIGL